MAEMDIRDSVRQPGPADSGVRFWSLLDHSGPHAEPDNHTLTLEHAGQRFHAITWRHQPLSLEGGATHFGFIQQGPVSIECAAGNFKLAPGMYFCVPGACAIAGSGGGQVTSQIGHRGLFQIGGPVERAGRLAYIDGCSDTLLISPVLRGEPCLNLLCLPPRTQQTAHTHPSFRCGLVISGTGICRTANEELPLQAGTAFVISAAAVHSFHTDQQSMRVIAFHPDSDFGPWHDDHPMVNRTFIDGTAAAEMSLDERRVADVHIGMEQHREVS